MYRLKPLPLVLLLLIVLSGCVSKNTYQQKANQADLYSRDVTQLKSETEALSTENTTLKNQLSELNARLIDTINTNSKLQQELLNNRANLTRQTQRFSHQQTKLSEQITGLQQDKAQLLLRIEQLQQERTQQDGTIELLGQRLEREDIACKARLASLKNSYDQLIAALEEEILQSEEEILQSEAAIRELEQVQETQNSKFVTMQQNNQDLSAQIAQLEETNLQLQTQLAEQQAQEIDFTPVETWLTESLHDEIANGKITITSLEDRLAITLPGDAIFDAGNIQINAEGRILLEKLGALLGSDYRLNIEGHSGNTPLNWPLEECYPTNWELSVGQANSILHFFQDEIGVPGQKLSATGYGEFQPVADNSTGNGHVQNSRIQINLLVDER